MSLDFYDFGCFRCSGRLFSNFGTVLNWEGVLYDNEMLCTMRLVFKNTNRVQFRNIVVILYCVCQIWNARYICQYLVFDTILRVTLASSWSTVDSSHRQKLSEANLWHVTNVGEKGCMCCVTVYYIIFMNLWNTCNLNIFVAIRRKTREIMSPARFYR